MRMTVVLSLALAAASPGSPPADKGATAPDSPDPRLDEVLRRWATAADKVRQSHYTLRTTHTDRALGIQTLPTEEVWFRKPDLLRVDHKDDKGTRTHVYLCEGREVHQMHGGEDVVFRLSDAYGFPDDPDRFPDTFQGILLGGILQLYVWTHMQFPIQSFKKHYHARLTEDEHWHYVELRPRHPKDPLSSKFVRLAINRKDLELRQIYMLQDGGSAVVLEFEKADTTTPVTPESIRKGLPVGWKRTDFDKLFQQAK